jgi:Kef-type K+ transport system membrane component KefB
VVSAGLVCGAITQWLGIHAILGFFLAGMMAGSANNIPQSVHDSVSETFHAVFVPVFFATLGIKIDFIVDTNASVTLIFTAVAMGGKFFGAWLGARLARVSPSQSVFLGIVFVPGGAMEIVVGILALELKLIGETVFVAIVFAALFSSIVVGPLMAWRVRKASRAPDEVA